MENGNRLPELTDEQRKAALARAAQARRERTEFKGLVKKGELSFTDAIADERANRIRVHELLTSVPGIGTSCASSVSPTTGACRDSGADSANSSSSLSRRASR